jgi:FKBP-type peptidyl-prolyl cis-trans isomerase SlyD
MKVADNCVVSFHYTLTDQSGEVLDSSDGRRPLSYLQGRGQIIPGLERQLEGLEQGAMVTLHVPAAEAYGVRDETLIVEVPRGNFSSDVDLTIGNTVMAEGQGQPTVLTIREVREDVVVLDANHPLAGKDLNFAVELVGVRAATPDERSHGHSHDGGHHH